LTDIKYLVHETVERVRRDLGDLARNTPCACKVQSDMPAVMIDPEQVAMALTELLNNAFESQPRGNIELSARLDRREHQLVITVSDDGRGMDEHTLSHAFDPFFSAKRAGRQGGMGLPRAQQWVDGHGGKLVLRSTPDSGTVATVLLPLDSAA
jgi:signal transduction histidine kinase